MKLKQRHALILFFILSTIFHFIIIVVYPFALFCIYKVLVSLALIFQFAFNVIALYHIIQFKVVISSFILFRF